MGTVQPETKYAKSGDLHIAYQVIGEGPIDLVFVPSWFGHVDFMWQEPLIERVLARLSSFSRLLVFDQRGTGLSDPVALADLPTLEERMDDIRAVMDAAGSERAAVVGAAEGGPCVRFSPRRIPTGRRRSCSSIRRLGFCETTTIRSGSPANSFSARSRRTVIDGEDLVRPTART